MRYEKTTILSYLHKIHDKELVLPAIQRDFVWDQENIYRLLDSIFRGYPFGTLLFLNTKQRVQFREFSMAWPILRQMLSVGASAAHSTGKDAGVNHQGHEEHQE